MKFAVLITVAIHAAAQNNNYPGDDPAYAYTWGIDGIPTGSAVWSGLPTPTLPWRLSHKLSKADHDPNDPVFINTLKAISNHSALGEVTFGDEGFDNPGFGGVGNYDVFTLKDTMMLSAFGQFYIKSDTRDDWPHTSCDSSNVGNAVSDCEILQESAGYGALEQAWWSLPKDSEGLSVIKSKNEVSQVCWDKGDAGVAVMDQLMICEFEKDTQVLVGMGRWRTTQGAILGDHKCDVLPEEGEQWDSPQKVVSSDNVYQYLIPYNIKDQELAALSPVNVKPGSCFICPNLNTMDETMAQFYEGECWDRDSLLQTTRVKGTTVKSSRGAGWGQAGRNQKLRGAEEAAVM